MTQYVITGRATGDRARQVPYNQITDLMSVGATVDLTLSANDETTLENAGIIVTVDTAAGHIYPR